MLDFFYPTSEDDLYLNDKINILVIYREDCKNENFFFFERLYIEYTMFFLYYGMFVFVFQKCF